MSSHGRDELTGRVDDTKKMEAVRQALLQAKPYEGRLGKVCDYSIEAREIAETLEGYYNPSIYQVEAVAQVALWRWGNREYSPYRDLKLAEAIHAIYWPKLATPGKGSSA